MRRLFASLSRIVVRAGFLAVALFLGLIFWYLPSLLNLDLLRPRLMDVLQKSFHCRVLVGNVQAELIPPGLLVGHVVLLDPSSPPKVLASVNVVHLWISKQALLKGHLRFSAIRFWKPRFILHKEELPPGNIVWASLTLPKIDPSKDATGITLWEVREGTFEVWDHTMSPTSKWVMSKMNGSYQADTQKGAFAGKPLNLGQDCLLDIHYEGAAPFPFEARFSDVALNDLAALVHLPLFQIDGKSDFIVKARREPALEIHAAITSVQLKALKGVTMRGFASFQNDHLQAHLQTLRRTPMRLTIDGMIYKTRSSFNAVLLNYDADIVRKLYTQKWVDRLSDGGSVTFTAQRDARHAWQWSAIGKHFDFENTSFQLPEWSARDTNGALVVDAYGITPTGGSAAVSWSKSFHSPDSTLTANVSDVTIRQVLEIFNLQSKPFPIAKSPRGLNPYGYEPWAITDGHLESRLRMGQLEVTEGKFDVAGMHLDVTGAFGLQKQNPAAHIQGSLQNIPVESVVLSFFSPPSPLTGVGQANFILDFPLSAQWIRGLTGPIDIQLHQGVLRSLKIIYRIVSVLNLGNYLRLRIPQVTAQGIVFESIVGHLLFQNGVVSSDDLFLKSSNMNIGAKGAVDLTAERVQVTLRLEMLRFLEDIFRYVPITHWIFKKRNKILFPLVVTIEGPWNNVDVD